MLKRIGEHIDQLITERFIPKLQKVEGLEYQPYGDGYGNYGIEISGEATGVIRFALEDCKLGSKRYETLGEIDLEKWLKQKKASEKSQAFKITKEYWDKQKKAYDEILEFVKATREITSPYGPANKIYQIRGTNTDINIYLYKFPTEEAVIGKGVGNRSPMRCVSLRSPSNTVVPTSFKKQLKKTLKETK